MFEKFPEFITDDTRYHDPDDPTANSKEAPRGNIVTFENMENMHKKMLTKSVCENNSILDLGSCIGASGAWALEKGAMLYTGVEFSKYNYEKATKNLKKHFSPSMWILYNQPILNWFEEHHEPYDVVLAAGILYATMHEDQINFLTKCAERSKKYLIIESKDTYPLDIDIPMSIYRKINIMKSSSGGQVWARCSNIAFIDMVLSPLGFKLRNEVKFPEWGRFLVQYVRL